MGAGAVTELGHFEISEGGDSGRTPDGSANQLSITGDVDLATSPALRQALFDAMDAGASELIVDIAQVELIDATGIGALVSAANRARGVGGRIILRSPSPAVRRVLGAVDLDGVIRVER